MHRERSLRIDPHQFSARENGIRAVAASGAAAATASGTGTEADQATRKTAPHRGAGSAFVPDRPLGGAAHSAQMPTGLPRGGRFGYLSRLRGRPPAHHRRGRSPPRLPRATTPMVRRWAAGTPMRPGGPEGRRCGQVPEQRQRPGQGPYPFPWAIEPTRISNPPGRQSVTAAQKAGAEGSVTATAAVCCRGRCRCPLPLSRITTSVRTPASFRLSGPTWP